MMKAQSAVEYLTTYGWAILGLAIVGGLVTAFYSPGCPVKVSTELSDDLRVVDSGLTADGDVELVVENQRKRDVWIDEVVVGGGDLVRGSDLLVTPGESRRYRLAEAGESRCVEKDIELVYSKGPLENINVSGTIQAPRELVEPVADFLRKRGDRIDAVDVNSSVMLAEESACFGDLCPEKTSETEGRVARSGDEMEGFLQTRRLDFKCFGNRCEAEKGDLPGYVSSENYTMDGTLNITDVTTKDRLCMGNCIN